MLLWLMNIDFAGGSAPVPVTPLCVTAFESLIDADPTALQGGIMAVMATNGLIDDSETALTGIIEPITALTNGKICG